MRLLGSADDARTAMLGDEQIATAARLLELLLQVPEC